MSSPLGHDIPRIPDIPRVKQLVRHLTGTIHQAAYSMGCPQSGVEADWEADSESGVGWRSTAVLLNRDVLETSSALGRPWHLEQENLLLDPNLGVGGNCVEYNSL